MSRMYHQDMNRGRRRLLRILVTGGIAATVAAGPGLPAADAVVPPKTCGKISVNGRTYQVKADQLTCSQARSLAKTYISTRRTPRGYRCKQPSRSIRAYCSRGVRVFFAIKR